MTDKYGLPNMPFRLSRRQIISGMAALGAVAGGRNALAQKRIIVPEGEFTPLPIAIPNFVAGTPGDAEVGADVVEAAEAHEDVADDHQRPPLAHHLDGAGDGAVEVGDARALHGACHSTDQRVA